MNGIAAYQENAILTQSRGRLVVLLYDGAINFLRQALTELEAKRYTEKGQFINKALDIIVELNVTLDLEKGGEVARNLRALYNFMIRHLEEANLQKDPEKIRDVIKCLDYLNQGWKGITS